VLSQTPCTQKKDRRIKADGLSYHATAKHGSTAQQQGAAILLDSQAYFERL